jgi:hypothetical protein
LDCDFAGLGRTAKFIPHSIRHCKRGFLLHRVHVQFHALVVDNEAVVVLQIEVKARHRAFPKKGECQTTSYVPSSRRARQH